MKKILLKSLSLLTLATGICVQGYSQDIELSKELDIEIKDYIKSIVENAEKYCYVGALYDSYKEEGFTEEHSRVYELLNSLIPDENQLYITDFILDVLDDRIFVKSNASPDFEVRISFPIINNGTYIGNESKKLIIKNKRVLGIEKIKCNCSLTRNEVMSLLINDLETHLKLLKIAYDEVSSTNSSVTMNDIKQHFVRHYKTMNLEDTEEALDLEKDNVL